jgi:fructose-1-phosphate kinase PfkB-like protein
VGAGDSLLAGFLHTYLKSRNFSKALRFGVICGAASVSNPAGQLADLQSIRRLKPQTLD